MKRSTFTGACLRLAVAAALASPGVAHASKVMNRAGARCDGMKLLGAQGVPAEKNHGYAFKGTCELFDETVDVETGAVKDRRNFVTVWGEAQLKWDGQASQLSEKIKITGSYSGVVETVLKCTKDPMISVVVVPPADTLVGLPDCVITIHQNTTNWPGLSNFTLKQKARPLLAGRTTLEQATELSKKSAASGGAPPPPPPKSAPATPRASIGDAGPGTAAADPSAAAAAAQGQGTGRVPAPASAAGGQIARAPAAPAPGTAPPRAEPATPPPSADPRPAPSAAAGTGRAMLINVEAEELAASGKISVAGGKAGPQAMASFGTGWSGDSQLFWHGGAVGAVLDLVVEVPAAATYAVELYLTRAPDYGQLKMQVDKKDVPFTVDAYAPKVMQPAPRQVGKFSLGAGQRYVSFMIVGKNAQSTGYFAGIDRVRLYPVGPP